MIAVVLMLALAVTTQAAKWNTTDLHSSAGLKTLSKSNPHAFSHQANHVVFTQITGDVVLLTEGKKKWRAENLHQATGGDAEPGEGDPYGFATSDGEIHVIYTSRGGDVCEFVKEPGRPWGYVNLTKEVRAPKADSDPRGFHVPWMGSEHVVYTSNSRDVVEIRWINRGWEVFNISKATDAPPSDGEPMGFIWPAIERYFVVYKSRFGQIIEMAGAGGDWSWRDRSEETDAPVAEGNPDGYVQYRDSTQIITYRDRDDHIMVLEGRFNQWKLRDFTYETRAPEAEGDPCAFYWQKNHSAHIYFVDVNDDVIELSRHKKVRWGFSETSKAAKAFKPATGDVQGGLWADNRGMFVVYRGVDGRIYEMRRKI
jgi:hypothetical protein